MITEHCRAGGIAAVRGRMLASPRGRPSRRGLTQQQAEEPGQQDRVKQPEVWRRGWEEAGWSSTPEGKLRPLGPWRES